jgi:motility quorum-sensing regulator/GCU-specific mRNA interferase toxin
MEKYRPHYQLKEIQGQMRTVADLYLTKSALHGIRSLHMSEREALQVIQALDSSQFSKSMTTFVNHRVWQDVYHAKFRGIGLYVKFQKMDVYFVISFKERGDG